MHISSETKRHTCAPLFPGHNKGGSRKRNRNLRNKNVQSRAWATRTTKLQVWVKTDHRCPIGIKSLYTFRIRLDGNYLSDKQWQLKFLLRMRPIGPQTCLHKNKSTPQKEPAVFSNNSYSPSHVPTNANSTEKMLQLILLYRHPADVSANWESVQGLKT